MNYPNNSGCYIFKDNSKVIYVGKAKNLKKRISSYFNKTHEDEKTKRLVKEIKKTEIIVTDSEVEALILENNLIKKYKPKYNILLKDAKRYAYIELTKEDFPRLLIARKKEKGIYFGPFTSAAERDYILKLVKRLFRIRTCKKFPKRPCLRFHINLCDAPCFGNISKTAYNENISRAKMLMKGNTKYLLKKLTLEMKTYSEKNNFEMAMRIRDQIRSLDRLNEKQKMERDKHYDEDILNFFVRKDKVYLALFNIKKGILLNKEEFVFDYDPEFLSSFLMQYYGGKTLPKEIIVPQVEHALKEIYNTVKFTVPKRGAKKKLLDLVKKNIELSYFGDVIILKKLQTALKLNEVPYTVECFDISHISGTSMVGSMVHFKNAKPDKSNYRRFKIRTVEGIDDFKAIEEVVKRRYKRLLEENKEMPDLIVIDGGKGQLNAALASLKALGLNIPTISIAKKNEEVFLPGLGLPIKINGEAHQFIRRIRDEAHRFAIDYNRLLRKKKNEI